MRKPEPIDARLLAQLGHRILTREQEFALVRAWRAGNRSARDALVEHNQRLVYYVARRYQGKGVSLEDLFAEGNAGLLRAIDGFDPGSGNKLATYATWWIRSKVQRAVQEQSRVVRVPVRQWEAKAKARSDATIWRKTVSLDAPMSDDGGSPHDLVAVKDADPVGDADEAEAVRARAMLLLRKLPCRERMIVAMRFGIEPGPRTLGEIGEVMKLSRQRVQQLEVRAMEALRNAAGVVTRKRGRPRKRRAA